MPQTPLIDGPVDPGGGPKRALSGRVVTMDERNRVLSDAVIYIENGRIVDIRAQRSSAPPGFESIAIVETHGTIFPGLIELHNHLPYNVLPLWKVPKRFAHRGQWSSTEEYQRLITTPMSTLGRTRYVPAVVRYVECKTLLGGVTTTQGVELFSNAGVRRYYRGVVRNVEQTNDPLLPECATRIADVDSRDAKRFFKRLQGDKKLILHLSEGVGSVARRHFLSLHIGGSEWAINENLVGIHCTGLQARDFGVLARHQASMVWSPLSNLLLYGETADVRAAKQEGVPIALGPDWSPTGSKNLLSEIKVARLHSRANEDIFSDRELVAMVTRDAASILGWEGELGSLSPGKRADMTVVDSHRDAYTSLLRADETEVRLVMIEGEARAGLPHLVDDLSEHTDPHETVVIGGRVRSLNLQQQTQDPAVGKLSLAQARQTLITALSDLERTSSIPRSSTLTAAEDDKENVGWQLALDELANTGLTMRPHLSTADDTTATGMELPRRLTMPALLPGDSIDLDALCVVDDHHYLDLLAEEEQNLPRLLPSRLRQLYR